MTISRTTGSLVLGSQGYVLSWDERGLSVQVTDYHAKDLHLSWETLLELARQSGQLQPGSLEPAGRLPS